uniref:MAK10-like protein n=1 Tax=Tanacetum cinerariifolium TaxID=118510 RepID=A0A6L2MF86_TANCI|nr:MAK10-like protein [Tanacetum cinerariifolium]
MEAHIAPMQPTQVNKITSSCEICSGPHDTQSCIENPEHAFVEYTSSRTDEVGGLVSNFMASQDARLSKFEFDFKQQQSKMTNKIDIVLKAITDRIVGALPSDTVESNPHDCKPEENEEEEKDSPIKINTNPSTLPDSSISFITEKVLKLNSFFESLGLVPLLSGTEFVCTKGDDGDVMFIKIVKKNDDSSMEEPDEDRRKGVEYAMSKILRFYKECLELRPEYVTGMNDEGEVT